MDFASIAAIINDSKVVAVTGHKRGDTDCLGSSFALIQALEKLGIKGYFLTKEHVPESLDYLFYYFDGEISDTLRDGTDLIIVLDSSDLDRLSAELEIRNQARMHTNIIHLDHHPAGDLVNVSKAYIVSEAASSTSELVYKLLIELDTGFDKNISTCLLAGIIGDTSSFQNQSTTEESLRVSSELLKRGARLKTVINHTFGNKDVDILKLWGLALERLTVNQKYGSVITYLTHEDISKFGLSGEAISGIVNYLNQVKGARMVVLVTEEELGQVKVSFRTRDAHMNVSALARQLGGGGHVKASGLSFPGKLQVSADMVQII